MVWKSGLTLQKCKKYSVFWDYREIISQSLAKKYVLTLMSGFVQCFFLSIF